MTKLRALLDKTVLISKYLQNMTMNNKLVNGEFIYLVRQGDIYLVQGLNLEIMEALERAIQQEKEDIKFYNDTHNPLGEYEQ